MLSKWNRFFWKVLPPSFFIALIVTGIYAITKLEFSNNLFLTFDMKPSVVTTVKLYFDTGEGFSEKVTAFKKATHADEFQTLRFAIPEGEMKRIRMDPFSRRPGHFSIRNMKVIDRFEKELGKIPLDAFVIIKQMKSFEKQGDSWVGVTTPGAYDSQIMIKHEKTLNKALNYPLRTKFQHVLAAHSRLLLRIFTTVLLLCFAVLGIKQKDRQG